MGRPHRQRLKRTLRQLTTLAFTRGVSKGELVRELIEQGLATIATSGERSLVEQLSARLAQAQPVAAETKKRVVSKPASGPRSRSRSARKAAGKLGELAAAG